MADDPTLYVQVETLIGTLKLSGADEATMADLTTSATSASRAVDELCDRVFYRLDRSNDEERLYTPTMPMTLEIDDLLGLTTVKLDRDGDTIYETALTVGIDFVCAPLNYPNKGRPYERLQLRPNRGLTWPIGVAAGVKVTGRFGWETAPAQIVTATGIIAEKLFKRLRDHAFPVLGIGLDGAAVMIGRYDTEVQMLLRPFDRSLMVF